MNNNYIFLIILLLQFHYELKAKTSYREKYQGVIEYYSHSINDSLKLKAAYFLIDNMDGHFSPSGEAITSFSHFLMQKDRFANPEELSVLWKNCCTLYKPILAKDSSIIDNKFLIENIEDSFEAWNTSPWSKEISFQHFCRYILPYKAKEERVCSNWRKKLREEYAYLIKDKKDLKDAFVSVMNSLYGKIKTPNPSGKYSLDVLIYNHIQRANCEQRCILFACILRSLGIPVAIDTIPFWANYSQKGHSWVALILNDGSTYTVYKDENKALQFNKIDTSFFDIIYEPTKQDKCPYETLKEKKVSKIYRTCYQKEAGKGSVLFSNNFTRDVSAEYGLSANLRFNVDPKLNGKNLFLATFLTGKNWIPIDCSTVKDGLIDFHNIGKDIVCVLVRYEGKKIIPLSYAVFTDSFGISKEFKPEIGSTHDIEIKRKYPLCALMPNKWKDLIGGCFEGANYINDNNEFIVEDTIAEITTMPYGNTTLFVNSSKQYKYLRYKSNNKSRGIISELAFYTNKGEREEKLTGNIISYGVYKDYLPYISDCDYSTSIKANKNDYWIGIDLGENNKSFVSKIVFTPISDTNYVEIGHTYELYGFDKDWFLIDKQIAEKETLSFKNVPKGIILLLKDKSKGHEERIFEYDNNKQIWY
ncbi:MAG: hypothetical protein J5676_04225 [Bacteroidaceae bacterium]|nr:hypothetical protein [Bacteroidaceae bacterium]